MSNRIVVALFALSFAACQRAIPEAKPFDGTVVSKQPLSYNATGLTIDENGRRLVWDTSRGLVPLDSESGEVVLNATMVDGVVEDVVAIPGGRFGIIARNEGRIVRPDGFLISRFCYLPGGNAFPNPEGVPTVSQLSRAIGFGSDEGRIYVQPQTFREGRAIDSQLGQFEIGNDQPLEWQPTPELDGMAGGIVVTAPHRLLIGFDTKLYEYDTSAQAFLRVVDLSGTVFSIDGLAIDRAKNSLVVLDNWGRQVVDLSAPAAMR